MSFTNPAPIIPQTVEQARQRDQLASAAVDAHPLIELTELRNAVLEHRDSTETPRAADLKLWALL